MEALNPDMLSLAREARGITQTELARRISKTASYVNKVENGFLQPSDQQTEAFSVALSYPVDFLTSHERVRGFDSPCLYHRKRKTLPVKQLSRVEANMHALRLHIRWILKDIDIEPMLSFHSMDLDEFGSPEGVAQALRRAWGIRRGPIKNVTELIEAAGGVVLFANFGTIKMDGLSCWEKHGPPFFYLNSDTPAEVSRFTIAHELGHLVMHLHPSVDIEGEADRFAAEFLMPADEIRSQLRNVQFAQLGPLKEYWRISMRNLVTRATKLGVIDQSRSRSLYVQLSQKGYLTSSEPFPLRREQPMSIATALAVHVGQHRYTADELIKLAKMDREDWISTFGDLMPDSKRRNLRSIR